MIKQDIAGFVRLPIKPVNTPDHAVFDYAADAFESLDYINIRSIVMLSIPKGKDGIVISVSSGDVSVLFYTPWSIDQVADAINEASKPSVADIADGITAELEARTISFDVSPMNP